jgi:hypothetical protein
MKLTKYFTVALVLIVAIFDVYVMAKGGTEASISHLLITVSYKYPFVPFLFGVLCGHLFWRMRDTKATAKIAKDTRGE